MFVSFYLYHIGRVIEIRELCAHKKTEGTFFNIFVGKFLWKRGQNEVQVVNNRRVFKLIVQRYMCIGREDRTREIKKTLWMQIVRDSHLRKPLTHTTGVMNSQGRKCPQIPSGVIVSILTHEMKVQQRFYFGFIFTIFHADMRHLMFLQFHFCFIMYY